MQILIVTDVFPPRCDGSGWSTFHMAKGLARAGHELRVVKPEPRLVGLRQRAFDGIEVTDFGFPYRDVPYLRNFLKNDYLYPKLARYLEAEVRARPVDVIHGQHLLSGPPAVAAGRAAGIPTVVTVRDHWPVCYFTTGSSRGVRCPDCGFRDMLACMREKHPRGYWAGIPLMPYMRRNMREKQRWLRQADAVIAVSRYIAEEVVCPAIGEDRAQVIPNFIDLEDIEHAIERPPSVELPDRFWLFVGKLYTLKGAQFVLDVAKRLRSSVPLVVVGEGPEGDRMRGRVSAEGLNVRFLPWLDNQEVWRVMKRADVIVVPSLLAEALSRTVLEAMAVQTPIVATDSGGIRDQLRDGESGLIVAANAGAFAEKVDALLTSAEERLRLAGNARRSVKLAFHRDEVLPRLVALYREVIDRRTREAPGGVSEG